MTFRNALLATAVAIGLPVVLSAPASAQLVNGFYIGGGLGFNILQDFDVSPNAAVGGGKFSTSSDTGFAGVLSVGYGFPLTPGIGLRAELEGNYRDNSGASLSGHSSQTGRTSSYAAMLNLLADFDLGIGVVPYFGAGVGYGVFTLDGVGGTRGGTGLVVDDSQGGLAYQGIVGLALPLNNVVPGLAVTAEYRYFSITGLDDFDASRSTGVRGKAGVDDPVNHSFLVGLRYNFGVAAAAAPPAAAAAPAAARTYLVFFDWNRADLTDRARGVIAEAATNAPQLGTTRIEVAGHTDTSGSAQYNQALSMRRAESVAAELERRGIPRSQMVLQAFGETRLLVPTADNVREPQNRRVEIVLR
jgi:OOP family OmpA-OmpF porin